MRHKKKSNKGTTIGFYCDSMGNIFSTENYKEWEEWDLNTGWIKIQKLYSWNVADMQCYYWIYSSSDADDNGQ